MGSPMWEPGTTLTVLGGALALCRPGQLPAPEEVGGMAYLPTGRLGAFRVFVSSAAWGTRRSCPSSVPSSAKAPTPAGLLLRPPRS